MKNLFARGWSLGFIIGFLTSCGSLGLKYYGMDLPENCYQQGKLLAADPKDDEAFSVCQPDNQSEREEIFTGKKGKCWIMKSDDFFNLLQDYERVKIELEDCQKNCE